MRQPERLEPRRRRVGVFLAILMRMRRIGPGLALLLLAMAATTVESGCRRPGRPATVPLWVVRAGPFEVSRVELVQHLRRISLLNNQEVADLIEEALVFSTATELLHRKVLLQLATQAGIVVPPSEMEVAIENLKEAAPEEGFQRRLASAGLKESDLQELIRSDLLVEHFLKERVYTRIVIDEESARSAYTANPQWSTLPEQVRVRQIVVENEDKAAAIRKEIEKGAMSFAEAASKYSIAPEATRGGDLGFFSADEMPPFFAEHCFSLKPDNMSRPISSPYGWHLFLLVDRRPARTLQYDDARAIIRRKLFEQAKQQQEKAAVDSVLHHYLLENRSAESVPYLKALAQVDAAEAIRTNP